MGELSTTNLVDQKLPLGQTIILALQHVFVMVAGAVVVPLTIASDAGVDPVFLVSCTLFAAAFATIIQCIGIGKFSGAKVAIVEGTSFAALAATRSIISNNGSNAESLRVVAGAVIVAGLFCFLLSNVWSKLLKFFPDVVTGTVVTVIGISLYPIGIKWIGLNNGEFLNSTGVPFEYIALAGITLIIILLANKFLKGLLGNLSVLIGIIGGTAFAMIYDKMNPDAMYKLMDVKAIETFKTSGLVGMVKPFAYGLPKFDPIAIGIMIVVILVIMTQATGSMMAIHNMSGREMDEDALKRGLRSNGMSTMVAGVFNSYPVTAFAQNIGMLSLTNSYSRFVTLAAGVILGVLSFLPKFAAAFAAIPKPVLGGAGFAMFGVVIVGGIRTLGKVDYDGNKNNIIVAVSLGLALVPIVAPGFFRMVPQHFQGLFDPIALGSVCAILLNLFFNVLLAPKKEIK